MPCNSSLRGRKVLSTFLGTDAGGVEIQFLLPLLSGTLQTPNNASRLTVHQDSGNGKGYCILP